MVPLIAKFLLVFFTLCYYNGGVLASLTSKLPVSEEVVVKSKYVGPLIEGYVKQFYGPNYHKVLLPLIRDFAGIPSKLPQVTVTVPATGRLYRSHLFVDMGEIFEKFPRDIYDFRLVFDSPSMLDLRTCKSLYKWNEDEDFGNPTVAAYWADDPDHKELPETPSKFNRSAFCGRQWVLGPLTLVVTNLKDDSRYVAYAPVKTGTPLRIWDIDVKYVGENKLKLHNERRLFPEIIPEDFTLYITRGWPDTNTKSSLEIFHSWFSWDTMEIELTDNYSPAGKGDILTFDIKADEAPTFENREEITLVFENDAHTMIVFSKGTVVIEPTIEAAEVIEPAIESDEVIETARRQFDYTQSVNANHAVMDNPRKVDVVPVFHGIYRIGILFFFVFCAFLAICYFSGIISHSDQHVQKYSDENKPNAETQTAQIQDDDHSNCCCCCV
eukprot:397441_1